MPDYCADSRSAARHHILTFKGSRQRSRAVAGLLALQAWELISKSSEIRVVVVVVNTQTLARVVAPTD